MVRNFKIPLKIANFLGISKKMIKISLEGVSGRFSGIEDLIAAQHTAFLFLEILRGFIILGPLRDF